MYKGYQQEIFETPWGVNIGFEHLQEKLDKLIPRSGRCEFPNSKNKHLDKLRRAQNAAYDLFNNGLGNKKGLFKNIYGWSVSQRDVQHANRMDWAIWERKVEKVLTPLIFAAAKEQGVN